MTSRWIFIAFAIGVSVGGVARRAVVGGPGEAGPGDHAVALGRVRVSAGGAREVTRPTLGGEASDLR